MGTTRDVSPDERAAARAFVAKDLHDHGDGSADFGKGQPASEPIPEAPVEPDWHKQGKALPDGWRPEGDTFVQVGPDGKDTGE